MASNRELTEQIKALSDKLGAAVETQGLNNQQLCSLLSDLELKSVQVGQPATAVSYRLAPRCYLNCARGVLEPGDIVDATDVSDGVAQLEQMAKAKTLIRQ